jgi:hypothetical protein
MRGEISEVPNRVHRGRDVMRDHLGRISLFKKGCARLRAAMTGNSRSEARAALEAYDLPVRSSGVRFDANRSAACFSNDQNSR